MGGGVVSGLGGGPGGVHCGWRATLSHVCVVGTCSPPSPFPCPSARERGAERAAAERSEALAETLARVQADAKAAAAKYEVHGGGRVALPAPTAQGGARDAGVCVCVCARPVVFAPARDAGGEGGREGVRPVVLCRRGATCVCMRVVSRMNRGASRTYVHTAAHGTAPAGGAGGAAVQRADPHAHHRAAGVPGGGRSGVHAPLDHPLPPSTLPVHHAAQRAGAAGADRGRRRAAVPGCVGGGWEGRYQRVAVGMCAPPFRQYTWLFACCCFALRAGVVGRECGSVSCA